ncbi:MAG: hypothetical protein ACFFC7_29350 [Candidatus Hermodarchaeota archaeon]
MTQINPVHYCCEACNQSYSLQKINSLLLRSKKNEIYRKIDKEYALYKVPSLKDPQLKLLCEKEQINVYKTFTKFLRLPEINWICPTCHKTLNVCLVAKIHERLTSKQHRSHYIEELYALDITGFHLKGVSGLFIGQEILKSMFELLIYRWALLKGEIIFYSPSIDVSGWRRLATLCRGLRELIHAIGEPYNPFKHLITHYKGFLNLLSLEGKIQEKIKKRKKTKQIAEEIMAWDALKELILDAKIYEIIEGRKKMSHTSFLGVDSLNFQFPNLSHQSESIMTGFNLLKVDSQSIEVFCFKTSSREDFDQEFQKLNRLERNQYHIYREKQPEKPRKYP